MIGDFNEETKQFIQDFFDFGRCMRPDGTFYGTSGVCRKGTQADDKEIDTSMLYKGQKLSSDDLDKMESSWKKYVATGKLEFPFPIPKAYDDKSGAPEAVTELTSLRGSLQQDKKTGKITIPPDIKVSDKARQLVDEWNSLDLSRVYVPGNSGNKLNVSGLGVMAGPRDSVPKDALRGLVQYVALRRQDATLIDTPKGKVIDSYRDPFTGKRRPFEAEIPTKSGDPKIDVAASQDHWNRPFGIYGIKSENDATNTVYMPLAMNVEKGESSPARYMYRMLVANGRLQGTVAADKSAVGGFSGRFDKDTSKDFLPAGHTRETEAKALGENAKWMLDKANTDVNTKYVPKAQRALKAGPISNDEAAKIVTDIAKQESKRNYFGGLLRFSDGQHVMTPYELNLVKGINLDTDTGTLTRAISERLQSTGQPPEAIIHQILINRGF
jgi:hypothetical protein